MESKKRRQSPRESKAMPETINQEHEPKRQTKDGTQAEEHSKKEVHPDMQKPNWRERHWNWLNKRSSALQVIVPSIFSAMILAAIIIQAAIYQKQWRAMQTSIEETKTSR